MSVSRPPRTSLGPLYHKRKNLSQNLDSLIRACDQIQPRFQLESINQKKKIRINQFNKKIRHLPSNIYQNPSPSKTSQIDSYIRQKEKHQFDNGKIWDLIMKKNTLRQKSFKLSLDTLNSDWASVMKRNRRQFGQNWDTVGKQPPMVRTKRMNQFRHLKKKIHLDGLKKIFLARFVRSFLIKKNPQGQIKKQKPKTSHNTPKKTSRYSSVDQKKYFLDNRMDTFTNYKIEQMILKQHEKQRSKNKNALAD